MKLSKKKLYNASGIKMSCRIHKDIDEFIKALLHKLIDDGIGKQVRDIFSNKVHKFKSLFEME